MEVCRVCLGSGRVLVDVDGSLVSRVCQHCNSLPDRSLSVSGIPARHSSSCFESFNTGGSDVLQGAFDACLSFPSPRDWLVLSGPPGVGKTHLLVSILRRSIESGTRGRYISIERLYSVGRDSFRGNTSEYSKLRRSAIEAPILCLDELGAGRATDFEIGLAQEIVNARYADRLPTVFATNYRISGSSQSLEATGRLGAQSISRIIGASTIVEIDSKDWRKKVV